MLPSPLSMPNYGHEPVQLLERTFGTKNLGHPELLESIDRNTVGWFQ